MRDDAWAMVPVALVGALTVHELAVFVLLDGQQGAYERYAWQGFNKLVKRSGLSRMTVKQALDGLERKGVIRIEPGSTPLRQITYVVIHNLARDRRSASFNLVDLPQRTDGLSEGERAERNARLDALPKRTGHQQAFDTARYEYDTQPAGAGTRDPTSRPGLIHSSDQVPSEDVVHGGDDRSRSDGVRKGCDNQAEPGGRIDEPDFLIDRRTSQLDAFSAGTFDDEPPDAVAEPIFLFDEPPDLVAAALSALDALCASGPSPLADSHGPKPSAAGHLEGPTRARTASPPVASPRP